MYYKDTIANLPVFKPSKSGTRQEDSVVDLSANENPLGPSPLAIAAIQAATAHIHRYPDARSLALRQALAVRFDLAPEMVCCTNGSDEMILLLCLAFLNEGDEAVMALGSFMAYYLRTMEMGGKAVLVPLRNYTHDLDAMVDAVTERTRLLFICNPNNPTGTTNGAMEVTRLLDRIPNHVLVVMDEAYVEFVERPDYPDMLAELRQGRQNVLLLRTFAKSYGLAGLRLGYALGVSETIAYLERTRPPFNVNLLAQIAGLAALEDEEYLTRSWEYTRNCRSFFERELRALGLEPIPSETNFVFVQVGDDLAVTDGLMERGFAVMPLSGWGIPGHIRISFGSETENVQFIQVLHDVLRSA
jgi:histidinol-phosphate aminotransferase